MLQSRVLARALEQFVSDITAAVPRLLSGLVFLVLAAILVKIVMTLVRVALRRLLPGEAPVYRQFVATVVALFLWFAVLLSFLSIVGLTLVAASLGTATGFLALGVSYALSGMLADAVSGIYLLRDPDFNPGDTVTVGDVTGLVETIELRKTRLAVDGDTLVLGNAAIESRWRKLGDETDR
ncbi:MAG: mechanosensitive ion channel domain-containing protein [Haloarculaceae archaeon]